MAQISRYPGWRHLRADASSHIQLFKTGKAQKSGRGLSFWFNPVGASISEIPLDDRSLPFLLKGQSADYQDLAVQGTLVWRVAEPDALSARVDFSIDLAKGGYIRKPIDQINAMLSGMAHQFILAALQAAPVRKLLEDGIAPIQELIAHGFRADDSLRARGLEIVGINIASVAPNSELARALQAPTFESLQQQADEASFARRAMAVEKERAIAENELNTQIELAKRQEALIAREDANARAEAETLAASRKIEAEADAASIRAVALARADGERAKMDALGAVSPQILMALAAQDFAGKLEKIDSITVSPEMISSLISQIKNAGMPAPQEH